MSEMKKKVTLCTKSGKTFITVLTSNEVQKMMEQLEKTPDNAFVDLWTLGATKSEENTSELNVRAGEIDLVAVEDVSNIALPPDKKIQTGQFIGRTPA